MLRTVQRIRFMEKESLPPSSEHRLTAAWLACGAALCLLFILPEVLTRPLFGDDAYYVWGATQIRQGAYPIRDFFAIDPAGAWVYFLGMIALVGQGSIGYWAMVAINVLGTGIMIGTVARALGRSWVAGLWAGLLFTFFQFRCTPAYGLVGKDMLAFPFVLGGLLLARRPRIWLLGHLILGAGLAIKPTLGAIWLVWMAGDAWLNRQRLAPWFLRALITSIAIGIPFLAATLWAEQNGWGWAAFKVNVGLRSSGYGAYWRGGTAYKLAHALLPILWVIPLAVFGWRSLSTSNSSGRILLASLLIGGLVNLGIQPMFNSWYFIPFFAGLFMLAGMGVARQVADYRVQVALMLSLGFFTAFIPPTNLRWMKLLTDVRGKAPYSLVEHQSRIMASYGLGNTPPYIQQWVREEVGKLASPQSRVGVLVTDGNLLWALRDYRPGFWAVWSPSWIPEKLSDGVVAATADIIVGVEFTPRDNKESIYYDRVAQLRWKMPETAVQALAKNYEPVTNRFGYVIYRKHFQR